MELIIIDYLQLMTGRVGGRSESRQQEISDISRSVKKVWRELDERASDCIITVKPCGRTKTYGALDRCFPTYVNQGQSSRMPMW